MKIKKSTIFWGIIIILLAMIPGYWIGKVLGFAILMAINY